MTTDSGVSPWTLAAWTEHWLRGAAQRCQPATRASYRRALDTLVPMLGAERPITSFTKLDFRQLALELGEQEYAPGTIRLWLGVVRCALSEAVELGLLASNPVTQPGRFMARRGVIASYVPTWDEVGVWVRAAQQEGEPYGAVAMLLARTGIRIGEALGLQWADVDFQRSAATIRRSGPTATRTKTGRIRTVPLSEHACEALRLQLGRNPVWVFVGPRAGRPLRRSTASRVLLRARRRAGLPDGFSPHRVRHGVGTELIARGEPLPSVQALLGHASPEMTLYYAKVAGERRAVRVAGLDD